MTAKVYVTLKKAVLDPQGKAVERSLAQLGLRIGSLKHFLRRPAGRALPSIPRRRPRGPPGSCVPPRAPPQPASAACAGAGQAPLLGGGYPDSLLDSAMETAEVIHGLVPALDGRIIPSPVRLRSA